MGLLDFAIQEARRNGIDPELVTRVLGAESGGNPNAVSSAGARGPMQLMPATAKALGVNIDDPLDNIRGGVRYLAQQLKTFGDPSLALAAYNAGPGNVRKYGGTPPFPETQNYVKKILGGNAMRPSDDSDIFGGQPRNQNVTSDDSDIFSSPKQVAKPQNSAKKLPLKIIDNTKPQDPLAGTSAIQRAIIGAGKAGTDFLFGIGLGDKLGLQTLQPDNNQPTLSSLIVGNTGPSQQQRALDALSKDVPAQAGNLLGQLGIMYSGGKLAQGAAAGLDIAAQGASAAGAAMPRVARAADILQKGGNALINPASYKQAAAAGAGFGLISQPGSIDERLANAAAGGIGGAAGLAVGRALPVVASRLAAPFKATGPIQATITTKLQAKGIDFNALPKAVQQQLVQIGKRSTDVIDNMDSQQLARMADFGKLGIQPTRGWVTRDPKDWWLENGLNTVDDQLISRNKDANQALLESVRDGTSQATDYDIGNKLQNTFQGYDQTLKTNADRLYSAARNMAGRDIPLDPHRFVNNASTELDQQMLGSKLPSDTLNWFQKVTGDQEPFDMGTALQRLQALNGRMYGTHDPAEAKALGIVKRHLTDAIEGYGGPQAGGMPRMGADPQQQLADAFRGARAAAADRFRWQDSSPLVDRVLRGQYTPEKLPDMLGSMRVDDLRGLAAIEQQRGVPVMSTLRDAAKAYIRDASTLQAETGGSFTVAGLRKALDKIGPEKGQLLFGPDGWEQYQRILRSAGNIYNAPLKPAGSSTFPNFMRMLQKTPIPGMPFAINVATTAAAKAGNMAKVGRALNPVLQVPGVALQPTSLPLLTAPLGLLSADQLK